uniref:Uncharacterized protein n=1 Tax=Rheinheimera sp. BAL341 TaxID=1708203 RepID=A0A486XF23_9GAMM
MRIGDDVKMHLEVNSIEAYRFKFTIFDNKRKVVTGTNLYAINCDIRLLDKPDSDMHCEDHILGNHVRPVCAYRPEQDNNTNNEQ